MAVDAVMQSPAQIAKRDKISKQAVSKKVRALAEKHGLEVERGARNAITKFNVAQYDLLRERLDDPSKVQRSSLPPDEPTAPPPADLDSYNEALRRRTWYEAERRGLELAELRGDLIRVAELAAAVDECGAEIVASIRRLQNEADALAAAVARDGAHGMRVELKKVETRMLGEIAALLNTLARRVPAPKAEENSSAQ